METKKQKFTNLDGRLTRDQMKQIKGGETVTCASGYVACNCNAGGVNTVTCIPSGASCCVPA